MQLQGLSKKQWSHSVDTSGHPLLVQSPITRHVLIAILAISLGGCSFASDALFPSYSGDESAGAQDQSIEASAPRQIPAQSVTAYSDITESDFGPTAVGQKATQFRDEFEELKANTDTRMQQLDSLRA